MNVILGAGIAGLGAYYADKSCNIFEQGEFAGGLCSSFNIDGFTFDRAVHLSFTKDETVRKIFDKTLQNYHKPVPYSWLKSTWLRHPAQNNLCVLPVEEKIKAVKGFVERDQYKDGDNFKDWNLSRYGQYMWDNLFYPYNKKYWCVPLDELGISWIGNRIYQPTLEEVLYGSYTQETPNTYYAKEMRYPLKGGYYSYIADIVKEAEGNDSIHYNKKAVRISLANKNIEFSDGTSEVFDNIYSSIPLPELISIIDDAPKEIKNAADDFVHTGIAIVSVGLNKAVNNDKLWFYIYDEDIKAARAYFPSNKSSYNAPEGCSSIQFEIYFNGMNEKPDRNEVLDNCKYALQKLGIANEQDIMFMDYRILEYANVVTLKNTEKTLPKIHEWAAKNGINLIGRFGRWEYLWSDQAFMSGYNSASK